jgi:Tol biopolymer transport system component
MPEFIYAGGKMNDVAKNSFYNQISKLSDQKEWKMLTDESERVEPSYKKIFETLSFNPKENKKIDIGLFAPEEWPSKNLGSYALSSNGLEIAFVIEERDASFNLMYSLYVLNVTSGKITNVLPMQRFPEISSICYAPDGKSIFFVGKLKYIKESTNIPQFNSLYQIELQTKNIDELVQYKVYIINSQSCSPDGKTIVYENSTFDEICVYDLRNSTSHKLTDGKYPTWLPDGEKISYRGKDNNYYLINPDGSDNMLFILNNEQKAKFKLFGEKIGVISGALLWSPDGDYVYYERVATTSLADVEHYIPYIMNVDTREELKLPTDFDGIKSWVGQQ